MPMGLGAIAFRTLFNKGALHANNRAGRIVAESDERKYAAGINYIGAYAASTNAGLTFD